ncbi:hypothetical protein BGX38DRAFT_1158417 [Terfezia claveryi]|nr:hypothetical protein BGX38DRAFT_1158417 [Terfezia claveryi]
MYVVGSRLLGGLRKYNCWTNNLHITHHDTIASHCTSFSLYCTCLHLIYLHKLPLQTKVWLLLFLHTQILDRLYVLAL